MLGDTMKRYQIFISSTYNDLKEERQAVLESILKLRHIPVGMEQFVATNEEQFGYIKRLIDETDYYVLIIGNRYGTLGEDGISYTEKEFDYAVSKNIPMLAFVHSDPNSFSFEKSEKTEIARKKLEKFRDKVEHNRLVSLFSWNGPDSLSKEVVVALVNAFNDFPRPGWERVTSYDNSELLNQINDLRMENTMLKEENERLQFSNIVNEKIDAFPWDNTIKLVGRSKEKKYKNIEIPFNISWRQILSIWGTYLIEETEITYVKFKLQRAFFGDIRSDFEISDANYQYVLMEFIKIGAIKIAKKELILTEEGKKFLFNSFVETNSLISKNIAYIEEIDTKLLITNEKEKLEEYIEKFSDFNSNPESLNYIGESLISASVFLSMQNQLSQEDTETAQLLIEEILQEASESERVSMGTFAPIFNLSKIYHLINIFQKGIDT